MCHAISYAISFSFSPVLYFLWSYYKIPTLIYKSFLTHTTCYMKIHTQYCQNTLIFLALNVHSPSLLNFDYATKFIILNTSPEKIYTNTPRTLLSSLLSPKLSTPSRETIPWTVSSVNSSAWSLKKKSREGEKIIEQWQN